MSSMEKVSRKKKQNPVEKVQQIVVAVETVAALEGPRVRKFPYLMTSDGGVVKVDIKRDNLVRQWKQCTGNVP